MATPGLNGGPKAAPGLAPTALDAAWGKGAAFLGVRHAIVCGAMTWVSERHLVAAVSEAGAFGVIACGGMSPEQLDEEVLATSRMTQRPFGVNLIVMHPELDRLIAVCARRRVSHVVLAGGLPPGGAVQALKQGGAKVLSFAPTLPIARKLIRGGVDALIVEGSEAGGHVGPVSTSVLAQEILPHVKDVPVFVAGGIGSGGMIAAYLAMGAAGVQVGTRFACCAESVAHPKFKQALIRASARDAQVSVQVDPGFKVIPVRALANAGTRGFADAQRTAIADHRAGKLSLEEAQLAVERYWSGALRRAVLEGDVERGSVMAGQSVGMVKAIEPAAAVVAELTEAAERALNAQSAWAAPTLLEERGAGERRGAA